MSRLLVEFSLASSLDIRLRLTLTSWIMDRCLMWETGYSIIVPDIVLPDVGDVVDEAPGMVRLPQVLHGLTVIRRHGAVEYPIRSYLLNL